MVLVLQAEKSGYSVGEMLLHQIVVKLARIGTTSPLEQETVILEVMFYQIVVKLTRIVVWKQGIVINAHCVEKRSGLSIICSFTAESTLERNPTVVRCAVKASRPNTIGRYTIGSTQERNHTTAPFATDASTKNPHSKVIWVLDITKLVNIVYNFHSNIQ